MSVLSLEIDKVRYISELAKSFAKKLFVFGALLKREKALKFKFFKNSKNNYYKSYKSKRNVK